MLNVFWLRLKDVRQSLPMIIGMTMLSLLLIAVFGMSFSGADRPDVLVADQDASDASSAFVKSLENYGGFDYILTGYGEGFETVSKGQAIAMVVIEDGFEENLLSGESSVTMVKSGDAIEQYTLRANLEGAGRSLALEEGFIKTVPGMLASMGIEGDGPALRSELREQVEKYPVMKVSATSYEGETTAGYDSLKHSFIGFILFLSLFTMVFGIGAIIEEKENQVWQRQSVAPVSLAQVMAGNMMATFVIGMTQLLVMVLVSRLLFDMDWGGSLPALMLVLASYVAATTCMGLFMSGLVSTSQQLGSFSPIVVVSTSMIGGCMWPLEIISSRILLFLADLTPQRWAYKGLKAVIVNNGGVSDVMDAAMVLFVIGAVFFVIGMLPYVNILKKKNEIV